MVKCRGRARQSATTALDTYGHVFDELDGAEQMFGGQAFGSACDPVRRAPDRVAERNETPQVAGLRCRHVT